MKNNANNIPATPMKFEIKNRWTGEVNFTAEIDADENTPMRIKLGLAARWGVEHAANLTAADLTAADLTDANLTAANLTAANLTAADLTAADLTHADLTAANLTRADLTRADLTDANLIIPFVPHLDAKILAAIERGGELNMSNWHSCETSHCRAGWACVVAGYAGGVLESKIGAECAARLIYEKSRPGKPKPNFYASDEDALSDIKACAAADPISKEAK